MSVFLNSNDDNDEKLSLPKADEQARLLTKTALICYLSLAIFALVWISLREGEILPLIYFRGVQSYLRQIIAGLLFASSFILISLIGHVWFECVRQGEQDLKRMIGDLTFSQILLIALSSSIGEEFLFRGAMQPTLGIWLTSSIFGLVHIPPTANLFFYPLLAAFVGFGLGLLFENVGGLISPVVAHFAINLVGLYRLNRVKT